MQADHHDIDNEFPEYHEKLIALRANDKDFTALVNKHDELDNQIRRLEEKLQPISDEEIEKMKYERTALKDQIYSKLRSA